MSEYKVPLKDIEEFLTGYDPEEYIVNLEYDYKDGKIYRLHDHPEEGKKITTDTFKPFMWLKDGDKDGFTNDLYNGNASNQLYQLNKYGLELTPLRTDNHQRLNDGHSMLLQAKESGMRVGEFQDFFKKGGIDISYDKDNPHRPELNFKMQLNPIEQYLIQTNKRIFKGIDEATGVHKLVFDLETTGLFPEHHSIFAIGIKDNRGYEKVIECWTPDQERAAIIQFFEILDELKPTIIGGYNSENFDWPFIETRCEILGLDIKQIAKTRSPLKDFYRGDRMLKIGNEVEHYKQTFMWGYNIVDIYHSVRRAQAIDSNLKKASLKYVCKYNKVAKENRVYVRGDKIYSIAKENKDYLFNKKNGKYRLFDDESCNGWLEKRPDVYEKVNGQYIIRRYLLDDLWETMEVDNIYNQTPFLLSKVVPGNYQRVSTMGTAGYWKLLMAAWSYNNGLAIPKAEEKREFVGGLSRLLMVGFSVNLSKLDFSSLYPAIQLGHDIFPTCDITGAMKSMLKYFHSERFKAKDLSSKYKKAGNYQLASLYKRKQLPLKVFINSMYGALTAPHAFPWGEFDKGEQVTCSGRQYLRLMVKFFMDRGFKPAVLDTDGVNFTTPEHTKEYEYVGLGEHERTEAGKSYKGIDAVIAEYNDLFMQGEMGLDLDGEWPATINLSRKNYALLEPNGDITLTGNTIKSKAMPEYLEEFLDSALPMLLKNDGPAFVNYYNEYLEKLFNLEIPIRKVASKSRVKMTIENYLNRGLNKNGVPLPKQAHMELAIANNQHIDLGETLYYVNNGTSKSHGAVSAKYARDKTGKLLKYLVDENGEFVKDGDEYIIAKRGEPSDKLQVGIYSYLLDGSTLENNPDMLGEYNIPKLVDQFNTRVHALLVAFDSDIRENIIRNVNKNPQITINHKLLTKEQKHVDRLLAKRAKFLDGKAKKDIDETELSEAMEIVNRLNDLELNPYVLDETTLFINDELQLVSGQPYNDTDQDTIEELFTPSDREVEFWSRVFNYDPNIWMDNYDVFDLPNFKKRHLQ